MVPVRRLASWAGAVSRQVWRQKRAERIGMNLICFHLIRVVMVLLRLLWGVMVVRFRGSICGFWLRYGI